MAYIFTFGQGQQNAGHYVRIEGDYAEARQKMIDMYGFNWGFQYSEYEWSNWCARAMKMGIPVETELK